ncbi:MAG: carboxypeptidase regulatory-like domain-containing protein [Candidatus Acidiferrales bacterium]
MARMIRSIGTLVLLLLFPFTARAQYDRPGSSRNFHIIGTVRYGDSEHPSNNVQVVVKNPEGLPVGQMYTNETGKFEFDDLAPGVYAVTVQAVGYQPASETVDLTMSSVRGLEIYLNPEANGKGAAGPGSSVSAHELSMPEKARNSYEEGRKKLYREKDAQGSMADFQQAVDAAPNFYEAFDQLGLAYMTIGNVPEAEKMFRKSIATSEDKYADADLNLGSLLLNGGSYQDGEKILQRSIQLDNHSWLAYYELGRAQFALKDLDGALKSAEQSRSLDPNHAIVYRLFANIHILQKNNTALLADLDAYIKLDPDSPAGERAKQMRENVARQVSQEHGAQPATNPKP